MEWVIELPQEVGPALVIVLTAILLDVVLGIMVHIKVGDFDVRLLPKFLLTGVIPYVGGLLFLAIAAQYVGVVYREIFLSVAGLIGIKYIAELKDKIVKLIG
jgi:hypothetical protein